jgi:hypothetical protein
MPFHLINYTLATGGSVTDTDMTAATDSEVSQRNSHYIFTEQYQLLAAFANGANLTRVNIQIPTWNQVTRFNVWPVNKSSNVPSNPQLDYWFAYPPPIPVNEEFTVKATDSANEQVNVFLWLGTANWNRNLPAGMQPLPIFEVRVNYTTPALSANVWSGLSAVTFEQSLRGGTYAVVGAQIQGSGLLAARFVFPRAPIYNNRKMRPGVLCQQAIGDVPIVFPPFGPMMWGELGRFSTFEPPQLEFFANGAGAVTMESRWWLVWLSTDMNVTYPY